MLSIRLTETLSKTSWLTSNPLGFLIKNSLWLAKYLADKIRHRVWAKGKKGHQAALDLVASRRLCLHFKSGLTKNKNIWVKKHHLSFLQKLCV